MNTRSKLLISFAASALLGVSASAVNYTVDPESALANQLESNPAYTSVPGLISVPNGDAPNFFPNLNTVAAFTAFSAPEIGVNLNFTKQSYLLPYQMPVFSVTDAINVAFIGRNAGYKSFVQFTAAGLAVDPAPATPWQVSGDDGADFWNNSLSLTAETGAEVGQKLNFHYWSYSGMVPQQGYSMFAPSLSGLADQKQFAVFGSQTYWDDVLETRVRYWIVGVEDKPAVEAQIGVAHFSTEPDYNDAIFVIRATGSAVPEPSTYALIAGVLGLAAAFVIRRRKQS